MKWIEQKLISGEKFSSIPQTETFKYFATHDFWHIFEFIRRVKRNPDTNYILLTHNSDWSVGKCLNEMGLSVDEIPKNIHWFAQNVDVEHPQIESVPIGLENSHWHPGKNAKMLNKINYEVKTFDFLVCAFFNSKTNPRRAQILDYYSQFDWCLSRDTTNGVGYNEYLEILNRSMFCVCPEGNGIDTHRMWEALYMGCIPVVEDSINIRFYRNAPMLVCGNLLDLEEKDFVRQHYELLYLISGWDCTILEFDYWKNRILSCV